MCVDYDPPNVWRETTRRARKPHHCDECGRTIQPGETYRTCVGLTDHWYGNKSCGQCTAALHWLTVVCRGYLLGDILDELAQHTEEPHPISTLALARLVVRMRKKWLRRDGTLWPVDDIEQLVNQALTPWLEWDRERDAIQRFNWAVREFERAKQAA